MTCEQSLGIGSSLENRSERRTGENVPEAVDSERWLRRQHGRDQQAMFVQVKRHLKLAEEFNVFLAMSLWKYVPLEHVGEDGGAQNTSLWTCLGGEG